MIRRPPRSPPFPYTTLFRSQPPFPLLGQRLKLPASPSRSLMKRSEEHTSELQSHLNLVCRLLLEKKKITSRNNSLFIPPSHRPASRRHAKCSLLLPAH